MYDDSKICVEMFLLLVYRRTSCRQDVSVRRPGKWWGRQRKAYGMLIFYTDANCLNEFANLTDINDCVCAFIVDTG